MLRQDPERATAPSSCAGQSRATDALAQRPRPAGPRAGIRRWLLALAPTVLACAGGRGPAWSPGPAGASERPTGCIDTPVIAGDPRGTSSGVGCGRERSPSAALIRGRVVGETVGGLPGAGIEGLWVTVHVITGPLRLDRLPPAGAEVETGPQGGFAIAGGAGELVVAVRANRDGPVLAAQRLAAGFDRSIELVLQVRAPEPPGELGDGAELGEAPRAEPRP